jgi:hypothetical protein
MVPSFGLISTRQLQLTLRELDPSLKLMTNITRMLSMSLKCFLPNLELYNYKESLGFLYWSCNYNEY